MLSRLDKSTVAWLVVLWLLLDWSLAWLRTCPPSEPQQAAKCAEEYYGLTQTLTYWVLGWVVFWIKHNEGLVTAAATIAIAWFTWTLRNSTDSLWDVSNKTLIVSSRPWLTLQPQISAGFLKINDNGIMLGSVAMRVKNIGKSPAERITANAAIVDEFSDTETALNKMIDSFTSKKGLRGWLDESSEIGRTLFPDEGHEFLRHLQLEKKDLRKDYRGVLGIIGVIGYVSEVTGGRHFTYFIARLRQIENQTEIARLTNWSEGLISASLEVTHYGQRDQYPNRE